MAYDQPVVPGAVIATVAANQVTLLLLKPVPSQYLPSLLRWMLTWTTATPEAGLASDAVPVIVLREAIDVPVPGLVTLDVGAVVSTVMPLELVVAERLPAPSYVRTATKYLVPLVRVSPVLVMLVVLPTSVQVSTLVPPAVVPRAYS